MRQQQLCLADGLHLIFTIVFSLIIFGFGRPVWGSDLPEILQKGELRHLGVPYANFVTGSGDGLDVDLMKLFAQHLRVRYHYVQTSWADVLGDLTGKKVRSKGEEVEIIGEVPIKGDIVASGLTILAWRETVVDFSTPVFPTQVWLIARADSSLKPIKPSSSIDQDISTVKALLRGRKVLGKLDTCLDPSLYSLEKVRADVKYFDGTLNELAPAIIKSEAELTLLDVPDALIALGKWPGKIKVIGPISPRQEMGCAFAKTSPQLRETFNRFFDRIKQDGTYLALVRKYYPSAPHHFPRFFEDFEGN
jgi:ABC-type amino acid transport substrate-binding protein